MFGPNFVKCVVIATQIICTHNQNLGIIQKNDKTAHKQQFFPCFSAIGLLS